jgi:hypothetical protein
MIADHPGDIRAAQSLDHVRARSPGDHDTWIQRREAAEELPGPDAHGSQIRMLDDWRECSIEIKSAQGPLLS